MCVLHGLCAMWLDSCESNIHLSLSPRMYTRWAGRGGDFECDWYYKGGWVGFFYKTKALNNTFQDYHTGVLCRIEVNRHEPAVLWRARIGVREILLADKQL